MLKTAQKNICAKRQQRGEKIADAFLSRIITSDDTWVHQYDPVMKRKSPESHHQLSTQEKKFVVQTSLTKVMSGTTKESCYRNSWRQVPQSVQSSTCRHSRTWNNEFEGFGRTGKWIKSSCCMTTNHTPVCTQGKQLQQWSKLFSLIHPMVLI